MAIMLDADVLLADERGQFDLARWLTSLPLDEYIAIAAITAAELFHGVERATERYLPRRKAYVEEIVSSSLVVPYTLATARIHARLWALLETQGKMIGDHDLILAATAVEQGFAIATFNLRHFSAVPGLQVIIPA